MTVDDGFGELFRVLGPTYRLAAALVAADEDVNGMNTGVRAVVEALHVAGPRTLPELARRLGTSRQYVQRTAGEAVDAGFVERVENPAHARSARLVLTDQGRERIAAVLAREARRLADVRDEVSDDDLAACLRVLGAVRRGLAALGEGPAAT